MGRNDNNGFRISDSFDSDDISSSSRKAYDQDKDNGIMSNRNTGKRPKSQDTDLYREYMRQYEEQSYEEERGGRRPAEEPEDRIVLSSYSRPKRKKKKKGMTRKKKAILISVIAVVLALITAGYIFIRPFLHYNHNKKFTKNAEDLGFTKVINPDIKNIALFGIDTREPGCFKGLSDSIMILSLNTKTKKVKVISLMRDTIIKIDPKDEESYYSKINQAYADGGPELAVRTINQNFDLDISDYATINFFGMVEIIDAVGGIDATVTEDELEWKGNDNPNLNNCMEEICDAKGLNVSNYTIHSAGPHHMNGVQAVAYSRVRHCLSAFGTNDDFGRTDRQRHVMEQLFNKATQLEKSKYEGLARALLPCSETSLDIDEILSLSFDILLKHPTFEQYRVPQTEWLMPFNYQGYGSCVYYDREYAKNVVHAIIYDGLTIEQYVKDHPVQKNDWFADIGVRIVDDGQSSGDQNQDQFATDDPQNPSQPGTGNEEEKKPDDTDDEETDPQDPGTGTDPDDGTGGDSGDGDQDEQ